MHVDKQGAVESASIAGREAGDQNRATGAQSSNPAPNKIGEFTPAAYHFCHEMTAREEHAKEAFLSLPE